MPSSWGLPEIECQRILDADLSITLMFAPASAISAKIPTGHVVILEGNLIMFGGLRPAQAIAMLLHEIGHVVNPPPTSPVQDSYMEGLDPTEKPHEFAADDYARHCGYGESLVSGLQALIKIDPQSFETDLTRRRIARIEGNQASILNLKLCPSN